MELLELLEEKSIPFEIKENRLIVYGLVDLSHTQIKEFPNYPMVFNGYLNISHTQIKELLDNIIINGYLDIDGTSIIKIPKKLVASRIYTSVKFEIFIYIEKDGKIGIGRYKKSIAEWKKFFKERKPFDYRPDLPPEQYNILEQDFKTAVKILKTWNS